MYPVRAHFPGFRRKSPCRRNGEPGILSWGRRDRPRSPPSGLYSSCPLKSSSLTPPVRLAAWAAAIQLAPHTMIWQVPHGRSLREEPYAVDGSFELSSRGTSKIGIPGKQMLAARIHHAHLPIFIRVHSRAISFCVAGSRLPGMKSRCITAASGERALLVEMFLSITALVAG